MQSCTLIDLLETKPFKSLCWDCCLRGAGSSGEAAVSMQHAPEFMRLSHVIMIIVHKQMSISMAVAYHGQKLCNTFGQIQLIWILNIQGQLILH